MVFGRIKDFFRHDLWAPEYGKGSALQVAFVRGLRVASLAVHDFVEGQLTLRASSLVYATLLSLVPLLAVSFSVLTAFGVRNFIEPALMNFFAPLGQEGIDLANRILRFVENMRVGVLGSLGLAFLLYAVISMIQQVEGAFNEMWRVKKSRGFARRFADYLSVLLVGPVLIFSAIGATASITNNAVFQRLQDIEPFGAAIAFLTTLAPYLFIILAFTFIYVFIPNTRVRLGSAFTGAVVAGVLWQTVGLLFASFVATSTRYDAIYSSFAILILFLIWLYWNWVILLFGGQIAYYHQHPEQRRPGYRRFRPSNRFRERLALAVMAQVTAGFYRDEGAWTLERLIHRLRVPGDLISDVVDVLEREGYLRGTGDDPAAYLPGHAPDVTRVEDLLVRLRRAEDTGLAPEMLPVAAEAVDEVLGRLELAAHEALDDMTLKDLGERLNALSGV